MYNDLLSKIALCRVSQHHAFAGLQLLTLLLVCLLSSVRTNVLSDVEKECMWMPIKCTFKMAM